MLQRNSLPVKKIRIQDVEQARIEHEQAQTEAGPEDARLYTDTGLPADAELTPAESAAASRPFGLDDDNFLAARAEAINQNLFLWRVTLWNDNVIWSIGKSKNDAIAKAILAGTIRPADVIRDFSEVPTVEMISTDTGNPSLMICQTEPEVRFTIEQLYSVGGWEEVGRVWAGSKDHAIEIARTRWINLGNIRAVRIE